MSWRAQKPWGGRPWRISCNPQRRLEPQLIGHQFLRYLSFQRWHNHKQTRKGQSNPEEQKKNKGKAKVSTGAVVYKNKQLFVMLVLKCFSRKQNSAHLWPYGVGRAKLLLSCCNQANLLSIILSCSWIITTNVGAFQGNLDRNIKFFFFKINFRGAFALLLNVLRK